MGPTDARDSSLPTARLQNLYGSWISPTVQSVQAAMDISGSHLTHRLTGAMINLSGPNSYPIAGYTYFIIRKKEMRNCTIAMELYRWFTYVLESQLAASITMELLKAPLTPSVLDKVQSEVLSQMECSGQRVADLVALAISIENGTYGAWKVPVIIVVTVLALLIAVTGLYFHYRRYLQNKSIREKAYIVLITPVQTGGKSQISLGGVSGSTQLSGYQSVEWSLTEADSKIVKQANGELMLTSELCCHLSPDKLRWPTKVALVQFQERYNHINVVKFLGLCQTDEKWNSVSIYPVKGKDNAAKFLQC